MANYAWLVARRNKMTNLHSSVDLIIIIMILIMPTFMETFQVSGIHKSSGSLLIAENDKSI